MEPAPPQTGPRYLAGLSLAALGIVYGDIGTSPLYALRECFHPGHGVAPTHDNVMGVLSLIVWSLIVVISIKYIVFVMRADNHGEGGILALMALARTRGGRSFRYAVLVSLGLFGSALLYGDGMITPAISVLSAIEGLETVTPRFTPMVVPITIIVLVVLFLLQRVGTARVGALFGPVMMAWFFIIAFIALDDIVREPRVLLAIDPRYAVRFFIQNRLHGFLVLGAVFLCVTGGEALYADMGHFGAKPIRVAWFCVVFPSLLINYFGQGALLLHTPRAIDNPFFNLASESARYPLVALATVATVIASQAIISGAYSLTRQAVQLGYAPRILIRHTSERQIGQIYIPSINFLLMLCTIGLVLAFQKSSNLAAAYGVAVTATMAITTLLLAVVERQRWRWTWIAIAALTVPLLSIDLSFFAANLVKVVDGGWFPLVVGITIFTLMATWHRGRQLLRDRATESVLSIDGFLDNLARNIIPRVPGTAVFLTRMPEGIPSTLLHNIKHNKIAHVRIVLLTIESEETPRLSDEERWTMKELGHGVYRLILRFGFMEDPDIPAILHGVNEKWRLFDPMSTSYFLGRELLIATRRPGMAIWRERLFSSMMRNSTSASTFFHLPPNQVIELGEQIEI